MSGAWLKCPHCKYFQKIIVQFWPLKLVKQALKLNFKPCLNDFSRGIGLLAYV